MKVPCGGFDLDESVFNVDKNVKQIKLNSPISYDYMPEGYPKKDGWSIEWDGNTEGKLYIPTEEDYGLYKISDMVLSDEDLLGAAVEFLDYPGNTVMIAANNIEIVSDDAVYVDAGFGSNSEQGHIGLVIARKDSIYAGGVLLPEKGVYAYPDSDKFKMSKETITPMSADFLPKNLNVVFRGEPGHAPTSCNVTYNELRDWVERDIPVFAVFITANSQFNIAAIAPSTNMLRFVYYVPYNSAVENKTFTYKSDGTFVIQPNQSP